METSLDRNRFHKQCRKSQSREREQPEDIQSFQQADEHAKSLARTSELKQGFPKVLEKPSKTVPQTAKKNSLKTAKSSNSKHKFPHVQSLKATMEYHKTKDILHVMRVLGHKNINNTLVYTQIVDFGDEEYTVRVAHSVEEDKQLIEAGFEYVTERDGFKIYRKRK